MLKIHLVAAARPNFMKVAPVYHQMRQCSWAQPVLVHTGQHYDANMSDTFFADFGLPPADHHLGIGSGTHAEQTAAVMVAYEKLLMTQPPDLVIVVGDVNSTMACTIAAKKLGVRVAHLEAGLRSFDRTMPEEINRILTDAIADILWTPSEDADANLRHEGVAEERITRVGNIMIDAYEILRAKVEASPVRRQLGLQPKAYGVVTLHRPSNVDDPATLSGLVEALSGIAREVPLVFPLHPRTKRNLEAFRLFEPLSRVPDIQLHEPLSYIPFLALVRESALVITDSGGIQEETTYLGIPCITLRNTTERPITVTQGTNRLADAASLTALVHDVVSRDGVPAVCPPLWDGRTAGRVLDDIGRRLAPQVSP